METDRLLWRADKQRQSSKQPLDLALFVALTTLSAGPAHAGVDDAVNSTVGAVQARCPQQVPAKHAYNRAVLRICC